MNPADWIAVPETPTEAQFRAGVKALRLPMKGVSIDPGGYPALVGANRPGFVVMYAAMVAAAPASPLPPPPAGFTWVPSEPNDSQWRAAVGALRLVKRAAADMLGDAKSRAHACVLYRAMTAAALTPAGRPDGEPTSPGR